MMRIRLGILKNVCMFVIYILLVGSIVNYLFAQNQIHQQIDGEIDIENFPTSFSHAPCKLAVITVVEAVGNTPVQLAAENDERHGIFIFNDGGTKLYLAYGNPADKNTAVTFIISPNDTWAMPPTIYTGYLSGVRSTGNGNVIVTETE